MNLVDFTDTSIATCGMGGLRSFLNLDINNVGVWCISDYAKLQLRQSQNHLLLQKNKASMVLIFYHTYGLHQGCGSAYKAPFSPTGG